MLLSLFPLALIPVCRRQVGHGSQRVWIRRIHYLLYADKLPTHDFNLEESKQPAILGFVGPWRGLRARPCPGLTNGLQHRHFLWLHFAKAYSHILLNVIYKRISNKN
jgi:hypothetical protein